MAYRKVYIYSTNANNRTATHNNVDICFYSSGLHTIVDSYCDCIQFI